MALRLVYGISNNSGIPLHLLGYLQGRAMALQHTRDLAG